jgi:hypothetical protein
MRKTTFFAALLSVALLWSTLAPDANAQWRRSAYYGSSYPAYYGNYSYGYPASYGGYYSYPTYYGSYYTPSYNYYTPSGSGYSYRYPYYGGYYYPTYYGGYVSTPWVTIGW